MRKLLSLPFGWLNELCLRRCCELESEPSFKPELIISSGGKSAFASRVLKRRYDAANIFVGVPERFPDHWFDLIISPVQRVFKTAALVSGVIPNSITPVAVERAGSQYWEQGVPAQPCWALLIGGDSKSHRFSETDWRGLIEGINGLAKRSGVRWLITTSRRTPEFVERMLDEELDRECVVDLVLYNREPRRVMLPFLAAAQRVVVTQDSLTMASEALCSGRPVTLLTPAELKLDPGSFFEEMIQGFPELPGVERCPMVSLDQYRPANSGAISDVISLDALGPELVAAVTEITSRTARSPL